MSMRLIVETGEGIPGADSYNTISELDAYMQKFGYSDWPVTCSPVLGDQEEDLIDGDLQQSDELAPISNDPVLLSKEAAARKAAIYIDSTYGMRFSGVLRMPDQSLAWPRKGAFDFFGQPILENSIPFQIKHAHAEVALLSYKGIPLAPTINSGPLLKRKRVDILEWEWDADSYGKVPVFGWVDKLLFALIGPVLDADAMDVMRIQRA